MAKPILTQADVRRLFEYDAARGLLIWKRRPVSDFLAGKHSAERKCAAWNALYAGKVAGCPRSDGYRQVYFNGRARMAHIVIWFYVTGEWPPDQIDHKFGVSAGDRIENLRIASQNENVKNQKMHHVNRSGFNGVNWQINRWRSRIKADGKCIHLGFFKDKADAIKARIEANVKYGFHENHGRVE